jgi:hypothetical protein
VRSKARRFRESLHVVGGVTTISKIIICMCLISIKMNVSDAHNIIMYSIAMIVTVDSMNYVCWQ